MKSPAPALLPLLRSRAQGEILAWVLLHPEQSFSLAQIAEHTGTSSPTVMREVDRLIAAGLAHSSRSGNQRLIRADTANIVYRPLAELLAVTFGPRGVLTEALRQVSGIERAFIYGSWAARYTEKPGTPPGDIDVLILGTPTRSDIDDAVDTTERRLRRDVNVRVIAPEAWADAIATTDPFATTVLARPTVPLIGEPND